MTKRKYIIIIAALALLGCKETTTTDQCLRAKLFSSCMAALPAGPSSTKYNDWAEVVDSCATNAAYTSFRRIEHVAPECRP